MVYRLSVSKESLEARAPSILKSKSCDLKKEIDRHSILLVRKRLNGNVCSNFKDYFKINEHNVGTRNRNILLQIPKVKFEIAKNGFFFTGAKLYNLLLMVIRENTDDFEKKRTLFSVNFIVRHFRNAKKSGLIFRQIITEHLTEHK